ncbi:MAG: ABC transporter ATP-binding protein [Caldilineaceae bacterium]|nr:ABC transporter ATP-binding protein [Caldilineaceae bacterium]
MRSLVRAGRFLSPYKGLIAGTIVTTILPVMMELTVPRFMRVVIDDGILQSDFQAVWEGALVMFLAAVVGAVATFGQGVFRARLSQALAFDIRNELFAKVMQLSHPDVDQIKTGQLITRLTSDVDVVRMFSSVGVSLALRAALMVVGSMIMLVLSDVRLSLIAWVMLLLTGVVLRWVFVKATPLYAIVQARLAALNVVVQENLSGMSEVRAFVQEQAQIARFSDANESLVDQNIKVGRLIAVSMPLIALFTNLGLVGLAWFGGSAVIAEDISLGQLVAFNSYLMVGLTPLLLLSGMLAMFSRATASSVRIWEILDTEPAVKPPVLPSPRDLAGRLEFRNVDFAYTRSGPAAPNGTANGVYAAGHGRRAGEKVLSGLDFTIEAGQTIGLIGATGSGKSTLMYLIPRFYDVQAGSILIDGIDVRDWDLKSLRRAVGLVAQHPALFNRSIRDNIAFGNPDLPAEDVLQVARMAQADAFIEARDDGLAHVVEEAGANLSGGQKQRLAIARALAVDPRILLLDDATSSVDLETEAEIQEAFRDASRGRTTIIVAHRVTSIIDADRILILDEGRVVADGTHAELLIASPIYRELYDSQLG